MLLHLQEQCCLEPESCAERQWREPTWKMSQVTDESVLDSSKGEFLVAAIYWRNQWFGIICSKKLSKVSTDEPPCPLIDGGQLCRESVWLGCVQGQTQMKAVHMIIPDIKSKGWSSRRDRDLFAGDCWGFWHLRKMLYHWLVPQVFRPLPEYKPISQVRKQG